MTFTTKLGLDRVLAIGAAAGLVLCAAAPAGAFEFDPSKAYVKVEGGYVLDGDVDPEDTLYDELEFDSGFVAATGLGYEVLENWRSEISVSFEQRDIDAGRSLLLLEGGSVDVLALMASFYRDFSLNIGDLEIKPFVGAGIGAARIDVDDINPAFPKGPVPDDAETNFAWTATGGLAMPVTQRLTVDVRYRYFDAGEYQLDQTTADYTSHAVMIGLRYALGAPAPAYVEPVPAAVQAPAPPPTPEVLTRVVYFDFDASAIRPDAASTLDEVATILGRYGDYRSVVIEAHADTVGRASYNTELSRKRASAVRKYLIDQKGVDADRVSTSWKGESEPAIQTGDGVKEQRNRRAEVVIRIR